VGPSPAAGLAGPAEDGAERRPQAVVRRFRSAVGGAGHSGGARPSGRVLLT